MANAHNTGVSSLAMSNGGLCLISGSCQGCVKVWKLSKLIDGSSEADFEI